MSDIVLLDGGMGQELIRRSGRPRPSMWSAHFLMDEPKLVRNLHVDYIRAGARVITVNSYSVTRGNLRRHGREQDFHALQERACSIASEARERAGEDVAIAGSLPPLGFSYDPSSVGEFDDLVGQYREIAEIQAPHVDLLVCETMSTPEESRAAAVGAQGAGRPLWVSWTVAEGGGARLRDGRPLTAAFAALDDLKIDAVLVNCSTPEDTTAAMHDLAAYARRRGIPFGAYANAFNPIPADFTPGSVAAKIGRREDLDPEAYAQCAMTWVGMGGGLVGGCCEIGPAHIVRLAERLREAGYAVVRAV